MCGSGTLVLGLELIELGCRRALVPQVQHKALVRLCHTRADAAHLGDRLGTGHRAPHDVRL